ncbi:MAG: hypothetical protein HY246_19250 [Proteobacteria bacterium]|nr:hypothetical protein [Pseudomonadota bacterium]
MTIKCVRIEPCMQRQEDPTWKFALADYPVIEGWLVAIEAADGTIGHGFGHSLPHIGSSYHGVRAAIELLAPRLIGRDPSAIESILADLDAVLVGNNPAKAAIDCALHDLTAKRLGVPLYRLFGGKGGTAIPQMRIVPIKAPEMMAAEAGRLAEKDYRYLKIKLDGDRAEDLARVRAIRKRVGEGVHLIADPNQSYTPKDAISALPRMEELGIELVEQPVKADDRKGLELVTRSVAIEADESAASLADVLFLVSNRIVDAISLKIPKLGGLRNTLLAAQICHVGRIRYRIGASFGPRLLAAQAAHLAASFPKLDFACELAEFDHLLDDPFEGIEVRDGTITAPESPGSGVRLIDRR